MELDKAIDSALLTAEPLNQVRSVVMGLAQAGHDKQSVLELLEQKLEQLRESNRAREEEVILDVMDFVSGWCSPHLTIPFKEAPETVADDAFNG